VLALGLVIGIVTSASPATTRPREGDPASLAPGPSSSSTVTGAPAPAPGPSPFGLEALVGRASVEVRSMRTPLRVLDPDEASDDPAEVRGEFLGPDRIVTLNVTTGQVGLWSTADLRRPVWVSARTGKLLEPAIAYVSTRDPSSARYGSCATTGLPGARIGRAGLEEVGPLPGLAGRLWPDVLGDAGDGRFVGADLSGAAVFEPTTGEVPERYGFPQRSRAAITSVGASPRHVAVGIMGLYGEPSAFVWIFDRAASRPPRRLAIPLAWTATALVFSPVNPDTLAVGRFEGYLHVIEDVGRADQDDAAVRTFASPDVPRPAFVFLSSAHPSDVKGVVWSPDGTHLYSASFERETATDAELRAWDVRSGQLVAAAKGLPHGPCSLGRSPDGRVLVLGTYSGVVELWLAPDAR
jgi:hypothetical protein